MLNILIILIEIPAEPCLFEIRLLTGYGSSFGGTEFQLAINHLLMQMPLRMGMPFILILLTHANECATITPKLHQILEHRA
jgi:hypothetical protein